GPAATPYGTLALAHWLLQDADAAVIMSRQAAVGELAPLVEWREQFAAHGLLARDARQIEIDSFLTWAESPELSWSLALGGWHATILYTPLYVAACLLTISIWILFALFLAGVTDSAFWLIPLVAGLVFSFAMGTTI